MSQASAVPATLDASAVTRLMVPRGYPSVSLLMTTTPAPRMTAPDASRLQALHDEARRRLAAEGPLDHLDVVTAELARLVVEAVDSPTDRAVAVFAAPGLSHVMTLPVEVEDRTVVDPTFATRDLVRALHRTPRHLVLVLGGQRAALFDGAGGRLAPAKLSGFPLELHKEDQPNRGRERSMRAIDQALGAYLQDHPAPVVLAGPERSVVAFRALAKNLQHYAGAVHGSWERAGLADLQAKTRPVLESYLRSREDEALDLVEKRAGVGRMASGIESAWLLARAEHPEMLAVEEGFRYPARLCDDGDLVKPATDVDSPDVIDDLVDELIETVIMRGGWVALVTDGTLAEHSHVALTLRR